MADSAASTQSRPSHAASKKRRQATVSTETENKLARAARSAQRLAQLSDLSRDDSTLDLFPDDPTRATLEAMNIDVRQGTLHGFELPDVVLAAVGAIDADGAPIDAKAARRAPRVAKSDAPVPVNALLSGLEIEPETESATGSPSDKPGSQESSQAPDAPRGDKTIDSTPEPGTPLTPAMAAATVARSVTALRQAAEPGATSTPAGVAGAAGAKAQTPRFATTFAKAAAVAAEATTTPASAASAVSAGQDATPASGAQNDAMAAVTTSANQADAVPAAITADGNTPATSPSLKETRRAEAAVLRTTPELDRARATAFADTVDALYGVIADQRHAATDHSRRMKWMLSIVVGALLVTVAIGITQTMLLMRLTRETTAQQHRIEQMMQNQQAAMASLIDTHIAMANAAASGSTNSATSPTAPATSTPAEPQALAPTHPKRLVRAPHAHKPKAAITH
ncbi:hypothetical protein P3T18_006428 [Paraburkholderia sp. GAS199]|uniref:hypothetical protein n=1 Tax=Paraburkholderia sp. GAS199 TaxID=3035126 RepID=UPI003D24DC7F